MIEPEDTDYITNNTVDWQRLYRDMVRAAEPLIHLATAIEYGQAVDQGAIGEAATTLFWFVDADQRMRRRSVATGVSLFGNFPGIEVQE
jgi:hypothetical protein